MSVKQTKQRDNDNNNAFQSAKKPCGIVDTGRMQKQNTADMKDIFPSETS